MILAKCAIFIGIPSRNDDPTYNSRCCKAVRKVPDMDMHCYSLRLTHHTTTSTHYSHGS